LPLTISGLDPAGLDLRLHDRIGRHHHLDAVLAEIDGATLMSRYGTCGMSSFCSAQ
jgi:hypothetical protein